MADTGASFGSFGGGFAKGLANVLYQNQLQKREDARRAQDKRDAQAQALLPILAQNVDNIADLEPYLQLHFPDTFGQPGKPVKSKKGEPRAIDAVGNVFKHFRPHFFPGPSGKPGVGDGTAGMPSGAGEAPSGMMASPVPPAAGPTGQTTFPSNMGVIDLLPQTGGPTNPATIFSMPANAAAQGAVVPGTGIPTTTQPAPAAPAPQRTFMGVPVMSPEQKAEREAAGAVTGINAKIAAARKLAPQLVAAGMASNLQEALALATDYFGLYTSPSSRAGGSAFQSVPGTINGKPAFGVFNKGTGKYTDPDTGEPLVDFQPSSGTTSFGTMANQAAVALGYANANAAIADGKNAQLTSKIQELLQAQSKSRTLGTGQGKFETPLTVEQAQSTGAPVGSTSAQMQGQVVGTPQDIQRGRSLDNIREGITSMVTRVPIVDANGQAVKGPDGAEATAHAMLDILPSAASLKGAVPGAIIAFRRRSNAASGLVDENGKQLTNREAMARLDSVVNSLINTMARTVDEQRGTQTEKDAERAYQALVDVRGAIMDPFGGDTRESAQRRLKEALTTIARIQRALPGRPTPNAPAAAPAAGPAAGGGQPGTYRKNANGEWVYVTP